MPATTGLFITGTSTDVGKTYVAAILARQLTATGKRVGVYKPVASGCRRQGEQLVSDDALQLWQSAGQPRTLLEVCPQCYESPVAPNVAARLERRPIDDRRLRTGLDVWRDSCDVVIVEGAGGWHSPLSDRTLVSDLAIEIGWPVVVVALNALGTINHTLLTLRAIESRGLAVECIVLNDPAVRDASSDSNAAELLRLVKTPLRTLPRGATKFGG